ncbi:MAG: methylmalonyl-CoA mutase, partial [Syntrophobacteraceae bacterium]|nr:methylmalonyl-CoA mutase [Syntrophobacteraceae bacterium]
KEKGLKDVLVVGGGIIPTEDYDFLKKSGVTAVFGPGTPTTEIVDFIKTNVRSR